MRAFVYAFPCYSSAQADRPTEWINRGLRMYAYLVVNITPEMITPFWAKTQKSRVSKSQSLTLVLAFDRYSASLFVVFCSFILCAHIYDSIFVSSLKSMRDTGCCRDILFFTPYFALIYIKCFLLMPLHQMGSNRIVKLLIHTLTQFVIIMQNCPHIWGLFEMEKQKETVEHARFEW